MGDEAKHTDELVKAGGNGVHTPNGGCVAVAYEPWKDHRTEVASANARRLAACWNACLGIDAARLEKIAAMPDAGDRLQALADAAVQTRQDVARLARASRR